MLGPLVFKAGRRWKVPCGKSKGTRIQSRRLSKSDNAKAVKHLGCDQVEPSLVSPFRKTLLLLWQGEPWWAQTLVKWPGRVTSVLEKVSDRSTYQGVHGWGVTSVTSPCNHHAGVLLPGNNSCRVGNCLAWAVGLDDWDEPTHGAMD